MNGTQFKRLFSIGTRSVDVKNAPPLVLLSPKGMLKLLARSNNEAMKVILIYLTELFEKLQLYDVTDFIAKYFCSVEGLIVGGEVIETLEEIYTKVPGELYNWIYAAVMSLEILTRAEVKN